MCLIEATSLAMVNALLFACLKESHAFLMVCMSSSIVTVFRLSAKIEG